VRTIELSQNYSACVDDHDYQWLSQWKWHVHKVVYKGKLYLYARRNVAGKPIFNREIAALSGLSDVDHHDGDGLNNQRFNLRPATHRQNCQNQRAQSNKSSRFKGVYWFKSRRKWRALIRVNGKRIHLGCFSEETGAASAYDSAALRFFGEFARINS
jgi:hypothetical protein